MFLLKRFSVSIVVTAFLMMISFAAYAENCPEGWTGDACRTPARCPYKTSVCAKGFHPTGETCKTGDKIVIECEADACDGFEYTKCPPEYKVSAVCQSGKIKKYKCDECAYGYVLRDGACVENLDCRNGGHQEGNECVCSDGWEGKLCQTKKTCSYTTTSCTGGYEETGETCASGNTVYKKCRAKLCEGYSASCGNGYHAVSGDTCKSGTKTLVKCEPNQTDSDVGKVMSGNDAIHYTDPSDGENLTDYANNGNINVSRNSKNEVIGLRSDLDASNNAFAISGTANANIKVSQSGSGNVYGMKLNYENLGYDSEVYNAMAMESGKATANIVINNSGNGNAYGMYDSAGKAYLMNAYAENVNENNRYYPTAKGVISIDNTGDGDVYGMYSANSVVNAEAFDLYSEANGIIRIANSGSGNAYGMWSESNAVNASPVDWSDKSGKVNGKISMINKSSGNAYAMFSNGGGRLSNETDKEGEKDITSVIEMANIGDGLAVGMYSKSTEIPEYWGEDEYYNIKNSGEIKIHNLGNGIAIGIYADGVSKVLNSGTITIDREAYFDEKATDNYLDDTFYPASSINAGKAIGIYGAAGSSITNTGTINIIGYGSSSPYSYNNDLAKAYGIYSEGGNVTNTGTINIDGDTSSANAIRMNGGKLFQDGVLYKYADWNNSGIPVLNCVHGTQSGNTCVCDDGWSGLYCNSPKLNCVHGNQSGNACVCDYGWTGDLCQTANTCSGYQEACGTGYHEVSTCQSGNSTLVKCEANTCNGYVTSCGTGYHEVSTCQSGDRTLVKCEANTCNGYVTNCGTGYHEISGDTCKSGNDTLVKCEINDCSGFETSCDESRYDKVQKCMSGTTPYYTCTPKSVPQGYTLEPCGEGYTEIGTFLSGNYTYYKCESKNCPDYQVSCGTGYHEVSGDTCKSGNDTLVKCEINDCSGFEASCDESRYNKVQKCVSGTTPYYTCTPKDCSSFTLTQCPLGYKQTSSCLSGETTFVKCEDCAENYVKIGTECYLKRTCLNGGVQTADGCGCSEGWKGQNCETPVSCGYETTSCNDGYEATGNTCKSGNITYVECAPKSVPSGYTSEPCGEGYIQIDAIVSGGNTYYKCQADCSAYPLTSAPKNCSSSSPCPSNPSRYRCDQCIRGYGRDSSGFCVKKGNTDIVLQSNDKNNSVKTVTNNNYVNVFGLNNDSANDHYNANNYSDAKISITNNSDGASYGVYAGNSAARNAYAASGRNASGRIEITNNGRGGAIGLYGQTGVANAQTKAGYVEGDIIINNTGDGYLYGFKTEFTEFDEGQVVGDVLAKNAEAVGGTAIANIDITNKGNGVVYGINAGSTGINSLANTSNDGAEGKIKINNEGSGKVYGMYAEYLTQNATSIEAPVDAEISIINKGNNDVYGMYSNGYAHNVAGYSNAVVNGIINIQNIGNGDVVAITSADKYTATYDENKYYFKDIDSYHLYNARANGSEANATINIKDIGDGNITVFDTIINNNQTFSSYSGNITYNTYALNKGRANSNIKIENIGSDENEKTIALSKDTLNLSHAYGISSSVNNIEIINKGNSNIVASNTNSAAIVKVDDNSSIENNIIIKNEGDGDILLPISATATKNSILTNNLNIESIGDGNIQAVFNATTGNNKEVSSNITVKHNGNGTVTIKNNVGTNSSKTTNKIAVEDTNGNVTIEAKNDNTSSVQTSVEKEVSVIKRGGGSLRLLNSSSSEYFVKASDSGSATGKLKLNLSGANTLQFGSSGNNNSFYFASGNVTSELEILRNNHSGSLNMPVYINGSVDNKIKIDSINSADIDFKLYGGSNVSEFILNNIGNNSIVIANDLSPLMSYQNNKFSITNEGNGNISANLNKAATTIKNVGNGNISSSGNSGLITLENHGNGIVGISGNNKVVTLENYGTGAITATGSNGSLEITNENLGDEVGKIEISGDNKMVKLINSGNNNITVSGDNTGNDELLLNVTNTGNGNINLSGNKKTISLKNTGNGAVEITAETEQGNVTLENHGNGAITVSGNNGSAGIVNTGNGNVGISGNNKVVTLENYGTGAITATGSNGSLEITNENLGDEVGKIEISGDNKAVTLNNTGNNNINISGDYTGNDELLLGVTNIGDGDITLSGNKKTITLNNTGNGALSITGDSGSAGIINTGSGNITLSGNNAVTLENHGNGTIKVTGADGSVEITNETIDDEVGDIEISGNNKTVKLNNTGNNNITISGNNGSADVTNIGNGAINISGFYGSAKLSNTGSGNINISGSRDYFVISNGTSDIDDRTSLFTKIINNGNGNIYRSGNASSFIENRGSGSVYDSNQYGINGSVGYVVNKGNGAIYGSRNATSTLAKITNLSSDITGRTYGRWLENFGSLTLSSRVEMANAGSGYSVGVYLNGGTITNNGNVNIHNLGDGIAVGIIADGNTALTNNGNIVIDRESYESDELEDNGDIKNVTYEASSTKGGKAIGIYGTKESSITNKGMIEIKGADIGYGIYSEGGNVTNTGTISINDTASIKKSIFLNRGSLFQDGKLIAGVDLSNTGCASGYTEFDNECYQNIDCGYGREQYKNGCICDSEHVFNDGSRCYDIMTCGAHQHQNYGECVCDKGYVMINGACASVGTENNVNSEVSYGVIDITNTDDADVYGMYKNSSDNSIYNAYNHITKPIEGIIKITNTGNGNVYGMYTDYNSAYNARNDAALSTEGTIDITNKGSGDVYGMYSNFGSLYNAVDYYYGDRESSATGIIKIINEGNGSSYGMYGNGVDNGDNKCGSDAFEESCSSDNSSNSKIEMVNAGDGLAVGLFGKYSVSNSDEIKIHNLGNGVAVGIYAGGSKADARNFGTIVIDRDDYYLKDTTYSAPKQADGVTPIVGGKAIGIYGEKGSSIYNYGTIEIKGADIGYGIYSEGGNVENRGTISINDTASVNQAIFLNRGALFQNGKLIAGVDFANIGCAEGALNFGGECFKNLNCGAHSRQFMDECICDVGYAAYDGTQCYVEISCTGAHQIQIGDACGCANGYKKINESDGCVRVGKSGYSNDTFLNVVNTDDTDVYGLYGTKKNVYYSYNSYGGNINITNHGNGNTYGMYAKSYTEDMYNAYANNGYGGLGQVNINKYGGGDAYGMYGELNSIIYNAYNTYNGTSSAKEVTGSISIVTGTSDDLAGKSGNVYGMYGRSLYNAYGNGGKANGVIDIIYSGQDNAYGMFRINSNTSYGTYNSYSSAFKSISEGYIRMKNIGHGNAYGMYGPYIYNAYSSGTYEASGSINMINTADGNIYGMYGSAINNNNQENITTSKIELVNVGDGLAVGMYGDSSEYDSNVKTYVNNSGEITIHNLGNGTAVGIYAGNDISVTNSGTITIDRADYVYGDSADDVYHADGATGGGAIGIYGAAGSTITNSGTINITGAENAYGIYSEGGNVSNTGTIIIDGNSSHKNSIFLNGGNLFQNGTLIAGVDLSNPECAEGYIMNNGSCYLQLQCGEHGTQVRDECICEEGYDLRPEGCYQTLYCPANSHQYQDKCLCDSGYVDINGDCRRVGTGEVTNNKTLTVENGIDYGYGSLYGMYNDNHVGLYNAYTTSGTTSGTANGTINITQNGYGDAYGMYGINVINAYSNKSSLTSTGNIVINHNGDGGNIYGMYGMRDYMYNAITDTSSSSKAIGTIDITGSAGGKVYGMYNKGIIYNAGVKDYGTAKGTINIYNIGDDKVYGMFGTGLMYNAGLEKYGTAEGIINITNIGTGDVYGMRASSVYNAYSKGSNQTAKGTINIVNRNGGNAYGMYGDNVYNYTVGKTSSTIEMANVDDGLAVGMYADYGTTIVNSGNIKIHNLGDGAAVGIYADGAINVTNSGTITIDRANYTDYNDKTGTGYPTYKKKSDQGGLAIGIYGAAGSTVTNSGTINISGAETAYGIYSEGGNVSNTGTIIIDGNSSHNNAIFLNGGKLLQYGKLIAGVDANNPGCADGYVFTNGKCYAELECGEHGTQVGNECICNSGYHKLNGICQRVGYIGWENNNDIVIVNNDNSDVYGFYTESSIADNSFAFDTGEVSRLIDINNHGDGNIYGMYGSGDLFNAQANSSSDNSNAYAIGKLRIFNEGKGDIYGMYGNRVFNASSISPTKASGLIQIINKGNGYVYGMHGISSADNKTYQETINSEVNIVNRSSGVAIGLYANSAENSGNIVIHNLGGGTAIGIYAANNGNNKGSITIDRSNYTDDMGTEDTSDDVTYEADGAIGGNAIGIYGARDSFIRNTGTISITGAENAYGIYAESGVTVDNTGTITIDGNSSHSNAIFLNGGKLLQNGKLVAGVNFNEKICDEGYILDSDGTCYQELNCVHGTQVKNKCVCDSDDWSGSLCEIDNKDSVLVGKTAEVNNDVIDLNNSVYRDMFGLLLISDEVVSSMANASSNTANSATAEIRLNNYDNNGDVYGVYGINVSNIANAQGARKNGNGLISITNNGKGNVYGIYGRNSYTGSAFVYNAEAGYSGIADGKINVANRGNGNAYGLYGYFDDDIHSNAYNAIADDYSVATGSIRMENQGGGSVYGIYGRQIYNAYGNNLNAETTGIISILNQGNGNAYGMYGKMVNSAGNSRVYIDNEPAGNMNASSIIKVVNSGEGNAYGMFGEYLYNNTSIDENGNSATSAIEMANVSDGLAVGMYVKSDFQTSQNSGNIVLHNLGNGTAVGIYADDTTIFTNSGTITIDRSSYIDDMGTDETSDDVTYEADGAIGGLAIGIYGAAGSRITNSGTININNAGTAYGIYSEGGNVSNTGTINIDDYTCTGESCTSLNNAILLNGGKLLQDGVMMVSAPESAPQAQTTSLNLNDFGGTVVASATSQFIVDGSLSGDLAINNNVIENGFNTKYSVKDMIKAGDVSGLKLISQSALFDAKLENDTDAVMTMKSFDSVIKNSSLADFLQANYAAENNEALFGLLKGKETLTALNETLNSMINADMFTRFTFEDLTMMRDLNADMNNKLFNNNQDYMTASGSITPWNFDGNTGSNSRYALYNTKSGRKSLGLGVAFSDIRSNDGSIRNKDSRYDQTFQMSVPMGYKANGFSFLTTPRFGYAYGTYERTGYEGKTYDGKIEKRMFGLMNEARYPLKFGKWNIAPAVEFNALGYHIKGSENDKEYALNIKSQNNYSLESGLGLYANRELKPSKNSILKLNAGMAVYHEFANPYELELGMRGMAGSFRISDNRRKDNRVVLRAGFDYGFSEKVSLIGAVATYIDGTTHNNANLDFRYNF